MQHAPEQAGQARQQPLRRQGLLCLSFSALSTHSRLASGFASPAVAGKMPQDYSETGHHTTTRYHVRKVFLLCRVFESTQRSF